MTHVLWLLKFDKYSSEKISSFNPYIPQKGYDFYAKIKKLVGNNNDISLIYVASNGPYLMNREETNLPTKDWNMTIITKHITNDISMAIKQFEENIDFNKIKQEFGIETLYNICFKMNDERINFLLSPKISNKILSRSPSYPYPTSSYQWLSKDENTKNIDQCIKFIKYKKQPFLMLNLMQIIDSNEDRIYSKKCGPLIWGLGGGIPIIGDAKCIENNYWTEILLVYYPNTAAFWNMWTSTYYMEIGHHKRKSTKDVFLQMTIPIYCHHKYSHNKTTAKL